MSATPAASQIREIPGKWNKIGRPKLASIEEIGAKCPPAPRIDAMLGQSFRHCKKNLRTSGAFLIL
jgi:hypothetical protein